MKNKNVPTCPVGMTPAEKTRRTLSRIAFAVQATILTVAFEAVIILILFS